MPIALDNTWAAASGTLSVTIASNSNRLLLVYTSSDSLPSSVTANGTGMTNVGGADPRLWALKAPSTGAYNVVVTGGGTVYSTYAVSLYNVDQTTAYRNFSANSGGSVSYVQNNATTVSGDLVIAIAGGGNDITGITSWTPDAGQTEILSYSPDPSFRDSISTKTASSTTTSMGSTPSASTLLGYWHVIVSVIPDGSSSSLGFRPYYFGA